VPVRIHTKAWLDLTAAKAVQMGGLQIRVPSQID